MRPSATNRRDFLATAAAWSLAGGRGGAAERTAPGELRLGVATYSLRKFSRAEAIRALQRLGVRYVSIKSFHLPYESSPEELRRGAQEFRDAGLTILSGGNIELTEPGELRARFEYAKQCGMPMMVCAPSHATLDAVERLVGEYDIKTAIHNHGPEDRHFPTPESVLEAVKHRDPRMGLCLDTGHTARTGANVVEWIRRAGPRLLDVHIKDLKDLMRRGSDCPVGDGAMPVVAILRELRAMNYQGGVMLEYEIDADDPLPGMIRSIAYLRGVLDALAA
mgnify:CR=1 FL=1